MKVLYRLKQSSRIWYERLSRFLLQKLGLSQINVNYNIFVTEVDLNDPIISIFIDDIKIMAPKETGIIQRIKAKLITAFLIIDIDPISFYLGLKVEQDRTNQTSKFSQPTYIDKILHRFYLDITNIINISIKEMFLF